MYRTKGIGGAGTIARLDASTHAFYDQGQKALDNNPPPAVVTVHSQQAEKDVEYAYAVVATLKTRKTYLYPAGATVKGGPLDGSSSNEIRWEPRPDAVSYTVYRMRGGEEGAIGSIAGSTVLLDTGQAADGKLPAPNRPRVTTVPAGASGATKYSYVVVARTATSDTPASLEGDATQGPSQLSDDGYNTVTWDPVPGALSYDIYRTKGGDSQGKIQTVSDLGHLSMEDRGAKVIGSLDALSAENADSTVPPMSTADTRFVVGGELGALSGKAEQANRLLDV